MYNNNFRGYGYGYSGGGPFGYSSTYESKRPRKPATWIDELKSAEYYDFSFYALPNTAGAYSTRIEITSRIAGLRKEEANIEAKYLEELLQKLVDTFKKKACYNRSSVSLGTVDFYTSETDMYETPVITHGKGKRKLHVGSQRHGSIPKGWTIEATVVFDGELSARMRNSILKDLLEIMGHEYNAAVEKVVKQNIKNGAREHGYWESKLYYSKKIHNDDND